MGMTLTEMTQRVYSRLAADLSTPIYADIHVDNLYRWADEEVHKIIDKLEPIHFQKLVIIDASLSAGGGVATWTLPTEFYKPLAVKVNSTKIQCELLIDPELFAQWDSRNFILTPTLRKPLALVYNNLVYVKPITGITTCYLDYIRNHPDFSGLGSADTSLSHTADAMLVNLLSARAFNFLEEYELAAMALKEAEVANVNNRQ